MKNKKILNRIITLVGTAVIGIPLLLYILSEQTTVNPKNFRLDEVTINSDYIYIEHIYYNEQFNYRGYDLRYSDGELRVRYRGGIELPYMKGTNSPDFYPIPNIYGDELEEIYLCDIFGKSKRLIWSKEAGIVS